MGATVTRMAGRATLAAALTLLAAVAGESAESRKLVPTGLNQPIDFFASVNPDCSADGLPTVRLVEGPYHGVVTTDRAKDFMAFAAGNVRHRCNGRRLLGTKLFYRSTPRFIGLDHLRILVLSGAGAGREVEYAIEVR